MRRVFAFIALLCIAVPVAAQTDQAVATGRLTGRVLDAASGIGIAGVSVEVVGLPALRVTTGIDGRYTIRGLPNGALSVLARRIGFAPKQVTGLEISNGAALEQDITLGNLLVMQTFDTISVSVKAERGSVSAALDAQRNAVGVVNTVTAEAIAKSPDGDAAQAVKRGSGITVEDGKHVTARGLGDRYTISSLNGARVPSPEPEKRIVPLDLFPAGLLQTITISKSFTPDLPGDFSGALVDIRTKEFPVHRASSLQIGSGYAAGATGVNLLQATSAGGEGLAMVNRDRDLPADVRAISDFQRATLSQQDINHLVSTFRNSWSPQATTGMPLLNGSGSIGGNDPVFGHRVGYLLSGSISSGTDVKDHQVRALADRGSVRGSTVEMDHFDGSTVSQGVLWGGIANVSTLAGGGSRISFSGLFNRSADNDSRVERGEFTSDDIRVKITRMQYVQRGIYSAQLAGEHQLTTSQRFDWAATRSGVRRFEPDRSAFVQVIDQDTPNGPEVLRWLSSGSGGAVRTFSDLHEHSTEASGKYEARFGPSGHDVVVRAGGLYRGTSRDAESFSYAFSANGASNAVRELPLEEIFDGRFTTPTSTLFTFGPLSQGGSYTARDNLAAGFAMADVPIGGSFRVIAGARYEHDHLDVNATSTLGSPVVTTKRWNDVLPSLSLNLRVSESQQLRFAASRTLARPEYRELTSIISRDVVNGENVQGNENLERTNITNADLRWEMYPASGEFLSVALFAKSFTNPIERVYGSGSGGTSFVFFTNAHSARDYGVELEIRKQLGSFWHVLSPVTFFGNATVMQSQIHLYDSTLASATNLKRRMVGQAPYVLNAGLTYSATSGASSATLLFNRVGERITAAGGAPLPDAVELPRNVLDLSLRYGITRDVSARLDAKNLLDSPYQVLQGTVTREYFLSGRTIQAGFQWRR